MARPYGQAIRDLRLKRGWSLSELSAAGKVSYETLWRAEQSGNVGVLLLQRIAHALNVDISVFFGAAPLRDEKPPAVWGRLKPEQRAELERYAWRLVGERAPSAKTE